ncbi:MAG: hypothetical protein II992_01440 [Lachnospiraceae bacterium]|nr:hypothetical protein [Lachnospiraceae bacterium]
MEKDEKKQDELSDFELLEKTKALRNAKSTIYVPKKERYEDLGSSAIIFTGFGAVGDMLVILSVLDIISIPFLSQVTSQITFFVMCTIFLIIGIQSWYKAKKLKYELGEEEDITDQINNWMKENITSQLLSTVEDKSVSSEINDLNKLNYISELTLSNFPDVEADYIDLLSEKFYNTFYE